MILVAGGAGYIGSHCVTDLQRAGYDCVVLDNLSEGHEKAVSSCKIERADLAHPEQIRQVFKKYQPEAVIHFAASCYVGESGTNPEKYYYNNVVTTLNLLGVMKEFSVNKIVFSSTCATYGDPLTEVMDEGHSQNPINVYGRTKLMMEKILQDYDNAYGIKNIALRYFNASGADNSAGIGESHDPETHLIPLVLQTALGQRDKISVFGDDYSTEDGTCIRDYIHVNDLAVAHRQAVEKLMGGADSNFYNLGTGKGHSVKEIIDISSKISGKSIKHEISPRREGDPAVLVASNEKAKSGLGWTPTFTQIDDIIESAWHWECNRRY